MSSDATQTKPWLTAEEIALACECQPEQVEALARQNHWPRVHGENGARYGVEMNVVRRALAGTPATVHGSIPPA
ncbi:hypothetical protein ACFZ8E_25195 [Methylobacterium sp. HMF5984]|uniref:hypothetical protein n=1 Tax=Methylobacterium sp. HMF5984 TaxID=3367370 RepID=UPI00385334A4